MPHAPHLVFIHTYLASDWFPSAISLFTRRIARQKKIHAIGLCEDSLRDSVTGRFPHRPRPEEVAPRPEIRFAVVVLALLGLDVVVAIALLARLAESAFVAERLAFDLFVADVALRIAVAGRARSLLDPRAACVCRPVNCHRRAPRRKGPGVISAPHTDSLHLYSTCLPLDDPTRGTRSYRGRRRGAAPRPPMRASEHAGRPSLGQRSLLPRRTGLVSQSRRMSSAAAAQCQGGHRLLARLRTWTGLAPAAGLPRR